MGDSLYETIITDRSFDEFLFHLDKKETGRVFSTATKLEFRSRVDDWGLAQLCNASGGLRGAGWFTKQSILHPHAPYPSNIPSSTRGPLGTAGSPTVPSARPGLI